MTDVELAQWLIDRREEVNKQIELIAKSNEYRLIPLWKKLIELNNTMIEVFWELMIYREKGHLIPIAYPHK